MNKIERAICDIKLKLEDLRRERIILIAEINIIESVIENLERIEKNNSIPYEKMEKK